MKTRILGKDLEVSAVGLGCMGFSHGYGAATDEKTAEENIRKAYEMGYTFFDTAEVYGTETDPHHNEKLVGRALKDVRDKVVISTKFGIHFDETAGKFPYPLITDARPETIRRSVEGSLERLGTDHIDLYFQHRMDPNVEPEEVAEVMAELIKEGKITHWGISEADAEYVRRANAVCPVTAVQNRYSMMARQYESLFPVLEELHIGFVAFSPMANGLLTDAYHTAGAFDKKTDYRASMPQYSEEAMRQNQQLFELLEKTSAKKGITPAQLSLAWMLNKKPYVVPIPGSRKVARMQENLAAADAVLSKEEVRALDEALDACHMSAVFGGSAVRAG